MIADPIAAGYAPPDTVATGGGYPAGVAVATCNRTTVAVSGTAVFSVCGAAGLRRVGVRVKVAPAGIAEAVGCMPPPWLGVAVSMTGLGVEVAPGGGMGGD
ncbi:MAG: hypothetical protein HY326_07400 [Chloroflexi bacterium]|nr:hypothetical protein [Chloroflexota bacterium]